MCLDLIDQQASAPHRSGVGWKVFRLLRGRLYPEMCSDGEPYVIGEWYEAYDIELAHSPGYPLGFHILATKAGAGVWQDQPDTAVRQVQWRHFLATGTQKWGGRNLRVIVAKEIMILRATKGITI